MPTRTVRGGRLVVVGANVAGLRAVEAARRAGFDGAVTLVGAEPHPPYNRPPLSKEYLRTGPEQPPPYLSSEASLRSELGVDLRLGVPATALRPDSRTVTVGDEDIPYTAAVLATGVSARTLPGTERLGGVHTLRTLDDARALHAALRPGVRIVVVGAGFVGAEVACTAQALGARVTVLEAAPTPLVRSVGEEMGDVLGGLLGRCGIDLRCGTAVEAVEGGGDRVTAVRLTDGTVLPADLVVVGIGARPATDWLAGSGLDLDDGVVCDRYLRTSAPGVYAAGDVARWFNPVLDRTVRLEHWTTAAEQGALAARNAIGAGPAAECSTVPYFWSDWAEHRVQFVGAPHADHVEVVAGDTDSDGFLALYRRGQRLIGALGLNQRRAVMRLRTVIARRATWAEALAGLGEPAPAGS
ncbi:NAD(P)/FAD-dependent oxidoreductase [Streptomyces deccanensis]|uniref:NAD(P)/FAD-dependent oxidoreductase n=1 Tax=Streptomyces deccanensis TaxID=424188 RepID=UPI001EFBC5D4|nr:FAD-dependent oxidoreductase [Streptomyces deccanensis]ULR51530.1 FAD-dependent oxidoreductase [Streptomyces deccanensis]